MRQILGDYRGFFALQKSRLSRLNIDISAYSVSHLAFRTGTRDEYMSLRDRIERHCVANVESVWNGRPISKLLLESPLDLGEEHEVCLIELIPPIHQGLYKMGLEHVGMVVGERIDEFARSHRSHLTGQQSQASVREPYFVSFDDHTHVKFYKKSLADMCIEEGQSFGGFSHVTNWNYSADC